METKVKKAIVLYGNGSTGKSTTLNILIDKILPLSTLIDLKKSGKKDRWAVVKYNNLVVAVITAGDSENDLKWYFNKVDKASETSIDIYIFACRTKGRAVKLVQREFSYILWERKWNISEENSTSGYIDAFREEANSLQAEAIIKTIDNI